MNAITKRFWDIMQKLQMLCSEEVLLNQLLRSHLDLMSLQ